MNGTVVQWGIVATGGIAAKFAQACNFESNRSGKSIIAAVASRSLDKALDFAQKWSIPRAYGSYEELFADPLITAVYIATPHSSHPELSIQALKAGKAVLCEKPVAITLKDFLPVIQTARECKLFFMEAMWMKFNPCFQKMLSWIQEGRIGRVKYLRSDFFLDAPFNPAGRYYNPALGGGALLDVGIYPVTCAVMVGGRRKPQSIDSWMRFAQTGVDLYGKVRMVWDDALVADLASSIDLQGLDQMRSAVVIGETGSIMLPLFWMANEASLVGQDGSVIERFTHPFPCNGYEFEIREVERCIAQGLNESPVQTWADSIMVMELLDTITEQAKTSLNGN